MPSAQGKLPALAAPGRAWLALGVLLLVSGAAAGSWSLSALGLAVVAALLALYLHFLPVAVLVWRRYLELLWWVPRHSPAAGQTAGQTAGAGLVAQRPFTLQVTLRNLGPLTLGRARLRVVGSRCIEVLGDDLQVVLSPQSELSCTLELRAAQAGQWFLHGAALQLQDPLGLFIVEAYFPTATPLKVLPRGSSAARATLGPLRLVSGAPDERHGGHSLRQRGVGGELRELREYAPGDPFKLIAWKPSARAPLGKLLVRDLDRETLITHYIALDIGSGMREGPPGSWKLDHALELALSYARAALDGGDRVGLITFDGEVYSHLRPGAGPAQRLRLTERLLAVMNVVDERFAGVTDSELCVAVARYLRQQEGLDARVLHPPPMDDLSAWARLAVAPTGELYDLRLLAGAARRALAPETTAAPPAAAPPAGDLPDLVLLRLFCQRRGIELPYGRLGHSLGAGSPSVTTMSAGERGARRPAGLAAALEQVAVGRGSQRVVLISDLDGVPTGMPQLHPIARAAALCRRRGHQLVCLRPAWRRYIPELAELPEPAERSRDLRRAAEIFGWEADRREGQVQGALARLGFHVIAVGMEDGLAEVLGQTTYKPAHNHRGASRSAIDHRGASRIATGGPQGLQGRGAASRI